MSETPTVAFQGENGALLTPAVNGNIYTVITAGSGVNGQFSSPPPLGAFTFQPCHVMLSLISSPL